VGEWLSLSLQDLLHGVPVSPWEPRVAGRAVSILPYTTQLSTIIMSAVATSFGASCIVQTSYCAGAALVAGHVRAWLRAGWSRLWCAEPWGLVNSWLQLSLPAFTGGSGALGRTWLNSAGECWRRTWLYIIRTAVLYPICMRHACAHIHYMSAYVQDVCPQQLEARAVFSILALVLEWIALVCTWPDWSRLCIHWGPTRATCVQRWCWSCQAQRFFVTAVTALYYVVLVCLWYGVSDWCVASRVYSATLWMQQPALFRIVRKLR